MIVVAVCAIIGTVVAVIKRTFWWSVVGTALGIIIKLLICVSEKNEEISSLGSEKHNLEIKTEQLSKIISKLNCDIDKTKKSLKDERTKRFIDKINLAKILSVDVSKVESELAEDSMDMVEKAIDDLLCNAVSEIKAYPYMAKIIADFETIGIDKIANSLNWGNSRSRETQYISIKTISNNAKGLIAKYKICEYKYLRLISANPGIEQSVSEDFLMGEVNDEASELRCQLKDLKRKLQLKELKNEINSIDKLKADNQRLNFEKELFRAKATLYDSSKSNLQAIPYMAKLISDFETIDLKKLEISLALEKYSERQKIPKIKEIRAETKALLEQYKIYEYQLSYAINLFPALKDVLDSDFNDLPNSLNLESAEHDYVRDYLSSEEWNSLSATEKNQLALDRYCQSHNKSKWQIGRDYELYIGFMFQKSGYSVDYFGSYMGLEDLGRDIIATKQGKTLIVQCKYWSSVKTIHEKHIAQLYGTLVEYCIENHKSLGSDVKGAFVTNIEFSATAKRFARFLNIDIYGSVDRGIYPMIKCNIGKDEYGNQTKIYHLPFDQQYDSVKIDKPGECFAFSVREAEQKGFRRAYKWYGNN